jgi:hypothetical protein
MASATLPAKLPGEKVYVDFDFTDLFNDGVRSGVTIAGTPGVAVLARIGTENPVTLVAQGNGAIDDTNLIWSVLYKAGLPGVSYSLICDAIGSNGAEQQITLLLPVVDFRLG